MSIFKFTLPSGAVYTVNGPADATKEQAARIFYQQVAAGSLVGFRTGDTLASAQATVEAFGLDRLDRGIAGVDTVAVLAIASGLPIVASVPNLVDVIVDNPVNQAAVVSIQGPVGPIGPLTTDQVKSLMAQVAQQVNQPATEISQAKGIGKYGLSSCQLERIGYLKPGLPQKYLSPRCLPNSNCFVNVMRVPDIFTGKDHVKNVDAILSNEKLQDSMQYQLMVNSYNNLVTAGLIQEPVEPSVSISQGQVYSTSSGGLQPATALALITGGIGLASTFGGLVSNALSGIGSLGSVVSNAFGSVGNLISGGLSGAGNLISGGISSISNLLSGGTGGISNFISSGIASVGNLANKLTADAGALVQNATKFGFAATKSWSSGLSAGSLTPDLNSIGKAAQYATNFATSKLGGLGSGMQSAAGFTGTVNRGTVDAATARIIGNSKIPTPSFGIPSPDALGSSLDIAQAQNVLKDIGAGTGSLSLPSVSSISGIPGVSSITGITSGQIPGLATPGIVPGGTTVGTGTTDAKAVDLATQQAAINDMENKKTAYEIAKAEYGISSVQAQTAFAEYKAALARLDALG